MPHINNLDAEARAASTRRLLRESERVELGGGANSAPHCLVAETGNEAVEIEP